MAYLLSIATSLTVLPICAPWKIVRRVGSVPTAFSIKNGGNSNAVFFSPYENARIERLILGIYIGPEPIDVFAVFLPAQRRS